MGRSISADELPTSGLGIGVVVPAKKPAGAISSRVMEAVTSGHVHPLCDIEEGGSVAVLYVATDRRLAVLMRMDLGEAARSEPLWLTFCGLSPTLRYHARLTCGGLLPEGMPDQAPGAFYMSRRFKLPLTGDLRGAALLLDAGPPPPECDTRAD